MPLDGLSHIGIHFICDAFSGARILLVVFLCLNMAHYRCSNCGCSMDFKTETANQMQYECPKCGKIGKIKGMKESSPSPIDTEVFF